MGDPLNRSLSEPAIGGEPVEDAGLTDAPIAARHFARWVLRVSAAFAFTLEKVGSRNEL